MMHKLYLEEWHPTDEEPAEQRFSIVWQDYETQALAVHHARGAGQRAMLEGSFWNVDREPSRLRQRLEDAGFTFEVLDGGPFSSRVYRIHKPRRAA